MTIRDGQFDVRYRTTSLIDVKAEAKQEAATKEAVTSGVET